MIAVSLGIFTVGYRILKNSLKNNCDLILCDHNIRNYLKENNYDSTRVDIVIIKKDLTEIKELLKENCKMMSEISQTIHELSFRVKNHEDRLNKLEEKK